MPPTSAWIGSVGEGQHHVGDQGAGKMLPERAE
jgi:hypothetical protein